MKAHVLPDHPDVIAFPPLLTLSSLVVSGGMGLFFPLPIAEAALALSIAAGLGVLGVVLVVAAVRAMRVAGTNIDPSEPALVVVQSGPFRFTRNPMYLAMCLLHGAMGFLLNNWLPLLATAALWVVLHFGVVLREERYLEAKFGEAYVSFRHRVRRWI